MLAQSMEQLARELLPGGRRNGAEWQCGSVAGEAGKSLSVHLYGAKAGVWKDFSAGQSGDPLDLVAACLTGGDLSEAYRWASNWLGLTNETVAIRRAEIKEKSEAAQKEQQAHEKNNRATARKMWLDACPDIIGTPVAAYLAGRRIDLSKLDHPPGALRFAPNHYCHEVRASLPAMLAAISNLEGKIIAVHQTWLSQHGGQWTKANLQCAKKVLGRMSGGYIPLRKGAAGTPLKQIKPGEVIAIGEGIETCLSVALACPDLRILAAVSLSNLGSVRLPDAARNVLILADRDEAPAAQQGLRRAIDHYLQDGRDVRVAKPPKGKDFNDVLG
ncbi:hypothetical protein HK17_11830 [Acetobacter indonesiensis]|uniref:Uncharacterized protein n=2 Tax=Acetobacter indonesiensis TaxID=104101 RepID=A0A252AXY9_9PROT|nr:toprim domain-containing protein [Acetobacter indonesiensis]OUI96309.1 hypothetical protein HK17_11830 [Acetobacter indonesiensis]